jgi:hypothetical protein
VAQKKQGGSSANGRDRLGAARQARPGQARHGGMRSGLAWQAAVAGMAPDDVEFSFYWAA